MSAGQNVHEPMAYKATSLDFINRPNPVEPHTVLEKHPLNGTPRNEKTAQQDLIRLLIDTSTNVERPTKRRKSGEGKNLWDLPKLPAVRNGTKRLRIPPTLSGLHQPPPNAGILPSMSTDQPIKISTQPATPKHDAAVTPNTSSAGVEPGTASKVEPLPAQKPTSSKSRRNKWSDEETAYLLKGVAKFGIGNWTHILNFPEYHFERRTAIDLKDRFRVCCPDDYKTTRKSKAGKTLQSQLDKPHQNSKAAVTTPTSSRSDRKSSTELLKLGINEPFEKSRRRKRTAYSAVEDDALLEGFGKHGNSWSAIREDEELGLFHRTATDLRDRFRTRYPDKYEKTGLAPRPEVFPKKYVRGKQSDGNAQISDKPKNVLEEQNTGSILPGNGPETSRQEDNTKESKQAFFPKKQATVSLLHYDDVFWGAPFDVDETETERITLDRRILDWPSDVARPAAPAGTAEKDVIDPLATLNLPRRPMAAARTNTLMAYNAGSGATLPSLATITAESNDIDDQLELPSLMGAFGAFDKGGNHFPTLEELWK